MAGRTFVTGDIHGDLSALLRLVARWPEIHETDTLVFLGDYVNRGPHAAQVVAFLRDLPSRVPAKVVTLRGNHEDAWLRIIDHGWNDFVNTASFGCCATFTSYVGQASESDDRTFERGLFLPTEVVDWFRALPLFYEDDRAIYVHAGLGRIEGRFLHPSETEPKTALLWYRDAHFFRSYRGKRVVFGHTSTSLLPEELSGFTPSDPGDMWAGPSAIGLDTGAGRGGFLTTLELPSRRVYESR